MIRCAEGIVVDVRWQARAIFLITISTCPKAYPPILRLVILDSYLHGLLLALVDDGWQLFNCAYILVSATVLLASRTDLGHLRDFVWCIRELRSRTSGLGQTGMIEDIRGSL